MIDLSEKEKKAIELLKQPPDLPFIYCEREKAIRIVLKLIKKQQKEIKDLKEKHKTTKQMNKNLIEVLKNSISKDKIREIISKYVDIEEHINYTSQELYGEDLKNMIIELIEEN